MRRIVLFFLVFFSIAAYAQKDLQTKGLKISVDGKGKIVSLYGDKEYLPEKTESYLVSLKMEGKEYIPTNVKWKGDLAVASFVKNIQLSIKVKKADSYLKFEVVKGKNMDQVDALLWGPFATTISETIGDFVGVVRNKQYAIGIQALNVKTTGGKLDNPEGAVFARGTAAVKQDYGSSLQAFCINRSKPQVIKAWNRFDKTQVVADPGFGIKGSAIALFGAPEPKALAVIGEIEVGEGLPHILIDGEWVKSSPKAGRPYIISSFGEATVDQMLDFTEKVGFYSLYQSHPFKNWGHFDLIPSLFPNGREGFKQCVEKAKVRNIRMGLHTLTNFITTNDSYVTPVPHKDLAVHAVTTLSKDVAEDDTEIFIENPESYDFKSTLQTVRIGDELIRFSTVTKEAPYKLLGCIRGSFGTTVTAHKKGEKIGRMVDHGYKTFYPNWNLQKEMIDNLIDFFNETGVAHLDFDGHEGAYSTGYGDASKDYFSKRFIDGVDHMVVNGTSRSSHFYWHINTYMNWGEPWYGGMKESQNNVRFNNQAVLERNYQPNMLGWFWFHKKTTLEEMEWMLARAAGWNAGYALVVHPKDIKANPYTEEVIKNIRIWEEAKNRHIFNESQKNLLKAGENDFSLTKASDNEFHLQYYKKDKFVHENIVLQPGQPNYTEWEFENNAKEQKLYFQLGAKGDEGLISNIQIEVDGYHTFTLPMTLKAGYSCIYNAGDELLIYDEKGRMKKKETIDFGGIKMDKGSHNMRVTCEFSDGSDLNLKGIVKLKDKVDIIKL